MAIIEDCPGLQVQVIANGNALHEYRDAEVEDVPKEVTRYVEVEREGTFEVLTKFLKTYVASYGIRVEVRLDGNKVNSYLMRLKELKDESGHKSSGARSKIGGRWHTSNFLFSSFVFDQDSAKKLDKATDDKLKKTGTITVLLHRIKNIRWPRLSSKKELLALLEHHRGVDTPVRSIKRERDDDAHVDENEKRRKKEVIVLDE